MVPDTIGVAASPPRAPLVIEVLAPSVVGFGAPRLPPPGAGPRPHDVGSQEAYQLFRLLDRLRERFGTRVVIHLVEPLSWAWFLRVLRHRPRQYPVFLVGEAVVTGLDEQAVTDRVARALEMAR